MTGRLALGTLSALLASNLVAAPAAAADYSWLRGGKVQTVTEKVAHGDLDLSTREGATMIERRVRQAARRMCLEDRERPLGITLEGRSCYKEAVRMARAGVERLRAEKMTRRASTEQDGTAAIAP